MKLLRESSNSGYVPATHELALTLVRKPEFLSAPGEAIENLQKASQMGFWKSTVVLGVLYRDGRGVRKDPETAYLQFRIAALQGGESAAKLVKNEGEPQTYAVKSGDEVLCESANSPTDAWRQAATFLDRPYGPPRFNQP